MNSVKQKIIRKSFVDLQKQQQRQQHPVVIMNLVVPRLLQEKKMSMK